MGMSLSSDSRRHKREIELCIASDARMMQVCVRQSICLQPSIAVPPNWRNSVGSPSRL
jgi:hypothetical protein